MTHDENRKKKTGMVNIPQSPERVQSSQYATFHGFHNMCAGHVRMCVCQCARVCARVRQWVEIGKRPLLCTQIITWFYNVAYLYSGQFPLGGIRIITLAILPHLAGGHFLP